MTWRGVPSSALSARAQVTYSAAGGLAEIGPLGVTKGSVLVEWCRARGIPASAVWAFGDMPNDVPMLAWAGTSFAVANAHPDVHAAASHSCPSNDDDGVACVVESLIAGLGRTGGPQSRDAGLPAEQARPAPVNASSSDTSRMTLSQAGGSADLWSPPSISATNEPSSN
jgi:hypothetical protein